MPQVLENDKFAEIRLDKFPDQIRWKLYRAKQHFMDFEREASTFMNVEPSGPGYLASAPESTPQKPMYNYILGHPMPASFGLIAGDYLQNLRSVLDYLVWQLILANNKVPHETRTAFPVCKSAVDFDKTKSRRLTGIPDEALSLIEALQPYPERKRGGSPHAIHILDELSNQNKHRQVLFTSFANIFKPDAPVPFPHIELEIVRHKGGEAIPGERLLAYIVFQGGIVKGCEVTAILSSLMDWLGFDVLPQFERFF